MIYLQINMCYLQYFYTGWRTYFGTLLENNLIVGRAESFINPFVKWNIVQPGIIPIMIFPNCPPTHVNFSRTSFITLTGSAWFWTFWPIFEERWILPRTTWTFCSSKNQTPLVRFQILFWVSKFFGNHWEFTLKPTFMFTIFTASLCHKSLHGINYIPVIVGQILGDRAKFFFVFHFHDFVSIELIKKLTWIQIGVTLTRLQRLQSVFRVV